MKRQMVTTMYKNNSYWFTVNMQLLSYGCMWEVGKHESSIRVTIISKYPSATLAR